MFTVFQKAGLQFFSRNNSIAISIEGSECSHQILFPEKDRIIHAASEKLGVVYFSILIGIDWINEGLYFQDIGLLFLVWEGSWQFLGGDKAIMIGIDFSK